MPKGKRRSGSSSKGKSTAAKQRKLNTDDVEEEESTGGQISPPKSSREGAAHSRLHNEEMPVAKINKALANVSTGADVREEMALTVGPNANWEEFIAVSPMCIAILGELICISTTADFTLEKKPPKDGFRLIKWPNSFRASLLQVANSGYDAFRTAESSMDQIRLLTSNVPGNLKQAVQILLNGTNEELEDMLPIPLNAIEATADQCLSLAEATEAKYRHVMELTAELLEASCSARGEYEQELRETEVALLVAREHKKTAEEQKEMDKKAYDNMERAVKKAEGSFYKAMDDMPDGWDILKMNVVESVANTFTSALDGITSCLTFGASSKGKKGSRGQTSEETDTTRPPPVVTDQGAIDVYTQAIMMQGFTDTLAAQCVEIDTLKPSLRESLQDIIYVEQQLSHILKDVRSTSVRNTEIKKCADKLCTTGINICVKIKKMAKSMQFDSQEGKDLADNILKLQEDVMTFAMKGRAVIGSSPTDIKAPCLRVASKAAEGSEDIRISQQAVQNARFKIEQASANLEFTREKYDKTCDKMMESSQKLGKILAEMQKLDIRKLDFENIKKTLIRGIMALGQLREEWEKLAKFFRMMSHIIRCSLNTSLKDFLKYADTTQSSRMKAYSITSLKKDMIYQQAFHSAKIAYLVNMISGTYVEVSGKYLMARIAGLGKLLGYDPEKDGNAIARERRQLFQDMEEAQLAITNLVKQRKAEFNRQIAARINKIRSQLEAVLPEDDSSNKTKERIQSAVQKGIENVKESKSDIQTRVLDADDFV